MSIIKLNLYALGPIALATLATPVMAAEPVPSEFVGDWQSTCDAWGVPATCTSRWQVGKHASHLLQDYTIVSNADGAQIFAGRGLYRIVDGAVDGTWEDSRGEILSLAGQYSDGELKVIWGDASREIGRSIYSIAEAQLVAEDAVLTDAGWRVFMRIDYARLDQE
ncbi:MAG: hypothetical protein AAF996_06715 [Pseudomonadota bacterium]